MSELICRRIEFWNLRVHGHGAMEPRLETCQPVFSCFLQFLQHHSILYPHAPLHCDPPRLTHRVCGIFWNSKLSSVSSRMFFHSAAPFSRIVALRPRKHDEHKDLLAVSDGFIRVYRTFISSPFVHRFCRRRRTQNDHENENRAFCRRLWWTILPGRPMNIAPFRVHVAASVFSAQKKKTILLSPKQRLAKQWHGYIRVARGRRVNREARVFHGYREERRNPSLTSIAYRKQWRRVWKVGTGRESFPAILAQRGEEETRVPAFRHSRRAQCGQDGRV